MIVTPILVRRTPQHSIGGLIDAAAALNPLSIAIAAPGRKSLTYGRLQDQVGQVVAALHAAGLGRGDRVATLLTDGPETAIASLGVMAAATLAPLNPAIGATELTRYMSELGARALIVPSDLDAPLLAAAGRLGVALIRLRPSSDGALGGLFDLQAGPSLAGRVEEPPHDDDVALVLHTSGTTSRPKIVPLTHRNLSLSAHAIADSLRLVPDDRCLNVMPLFHVHGLIGALLSSVAAGASVVCTRGFVATEFFNWLEEFSPSWYTAVPTMHQSILARAARSSDIIARHPLRLIRSCSAALPVRVADELAATFSVPVIEAYGMTEAAHQITTTPLPPGVRRPGSVGKACGPQVAVMDDSGGLRPTGRVGEIVIRGPSIMHGYENAEGAGASFVEDWLRTGDQGYLDDDGYLFITGRLKELINRAGEKIAPREVDDALLGHPAVAQAVAFGLPHPTLGEDVAAAVVLRPGLTVEPAELRAFAATRLAAFKVPRLIAVVDDIPRGPTGKLLRSQLGTLLGLLAAFDDRAGVPGNAERVELTPTEQAIAEVWAGVLRIEPAEIGTGANFFRLGGDSVLAAQLVRRVDAALHVRLELLDVFESPTLEALSQLAEARASNGMPSANTPIEPRALGAPLRLSFGEERTWWLDQVAPNSCLNHRPLAWHLVGPLDVAALQDSLTEILRRHEALRATFPVTAGTVTRSIGPPTTLTLTIEDIRRDPVDQRAKKLALAVAESVREPFDLGNGPLLRPHLFRLGDTEHVLLVVVHHIVFDGWSEQVFRDELAAQYTLLVNGSPGVLPELPIQYTDFAIWQRERLDEDSLAAQLEYWRTQLADRPPVLELPTDRARPMHSTLRTAAVGFTLSPASVGALERVGHQVGATLFMSLLSAFDVLLARYAGTEDVLVGVPVSGRNRPETESLIGFFVNTLVVRTDLSGDPSFLGLLDRVRRMCLEAYAHQDLPFDRLVADVQSDRDPSRHPLVQVMCNLRNVPIRQPALHGLQTSVWPVGTPASPFDLSLDMTPSEAGLACTLEYSTDLFDAATVEALAGHYVTLLEGIVADPEQSLSGLPLLTQPERAELLQSSLNSPVDLSSAQPSVLELFEVQVQRAPRSVAVLAGDSRLTYAELDRRANQVAHYLRRQGAGPESRIGLCLDRSADLIVGLLGILKSGAAYVPLDPTYPPERLAFVLRDARVKLLVSRETLAARVSAEAVRVVCLDCDADAIERESAAAPGLDVAPHDLAYVIYTSGSTGVPHGVMVEHGSLSNLILSVGQVYGLGPSDRVLQFASIAFDASAEEILSTLTCGAALVLRPDVLPESIALFLGRCGDRSVTVLNLPTAYWHLVVEGMAQEDMRLPPSVRLVVIGGEAARADCLTMWRQRVPGGVRLLNAYGPTEATVTATLYEVPSEAAAARSIPIGRPIANTAAYVLDARLQPVPVGVPGELVLGGRGLARGYVDQPELTARRFVRNPFPDGGPRLYRTGDRVRRLSDGNLEFLGRTDQQLKLRGFRIEPGEIEASLRLHPGVAEAVVLARDVDSSDRRLVAYLVPHGTPPSAHELRQFLHDKLPEYMLPAAYVLLDGLPMLLNGKVDRASLPAPEWGRSQSAADLVLPRTPTEEALARVWMDVLGIDHVGVNDDFFALGGHSLLAARVMSGARAALGTDLPLRVLFDAPTISAFATAFDLAAGRRPVQVRPLATDGGSQPLSFGEQRMWFADQVDPDTATYTLVSILRLTGHLDVPSLQRALDRLVERHEVLRTSYVSAGGIPARSIRSALNIPINVVDFSEMDAEERAASVGALLRDQRRRRFDLARGPLLRPMLARLAVDEHVLAVAMHHIITDAWSLNIFERELTTIYGELDGGHPAGLAQLSVQYADVAARQAESASQVARNADLAAWRRRLDGAPEALELPTDHHRPLTRVSHGDLVESTAPTALRDSLRKLGERHRATLFMVLLAAFQAMLARYSGQTDIVVGAPVSGRTDPDVESLIGFFVNTLVMRADASGDPAFADFLDRVREMCLDAYAHQDLPFERLVAELRPDRDPSRNPLVQVMFAFEPAAHAPIDVPGLRVEPVATRVSSGLAKFDLTLFVTENDNGLNLAIEYSTDLFERSTIQRLAGHYLSVLNGVVSDATRSLSQLPLLTQSEQTQLLVEWNNTRADFPAQHCVHQLVAAQAARTPAAMAVAAVGEQVHLTYLDLERRANGLAHRLRQLGVRPGDRVAVCLERSPLLVVAFLAVLKAGGAYVPLDPSQPSDRLNRMLADARPRVVLAGLGAASPPLVTRAAHLVRLDPSWTALPEAAEPPLVDGMTGNDPAYVMYTSGSSGAPKGVVVPHRAVTRLVVNANFVSLGPSDIVAQASNASFDAATFEIWGALVNGARLVVVPTATLLSASALAATIEREQLSVVFVTTALFNELAWSMPDIFRPLRYVLFGGETANPESARRILDAGAPRHLLHMYGPTETTTFATWYEVSGVPIEAKGLPIGRPIANTTAYVVDVGGQLVPVGVTGELYIGGPGVALGYLGQPELTAQKFVADRFGPDPTARLYRTGDLVRYLPDGTLAFIGRNDNQVKLRGFRIEPGEIEARLLEHPGVRQALVIVREDVPGDRQLVGYVVFDQPDHLSLAELQDALRERLPVYMLPGTLMPLDRLPLTPNGKIDRGALPAPRFRHADRRVRHEAPRDHVERQVSAIWSEVLGYPVPGVFENFFDLGGHSLLAARVVARIEMVFGRRLPLACFLGSVSVADLAKLIRDEDSPSEWQCLVPIQISGDRAPLFAVHGAFGDVLCFEALATELGAQQPVYGLQALGLDGVQAPLTRIEDMAERYIAEIRSIQAHGPYHLIGYSSGGSIAFEMARQLELSGERVALVGVIDHPPHVAGYDRASWSPRWALRAGANLSRSIPVWLQASTRDGWRKAPGVCSSYLQRRVGAGRVFRPRDDTEAWLAFRDRTAKLVDGTLQEWADFRWRLMEAQFAAVRAYAPLPYSGQVTVFRASRQPLLSSHLPDLGWGPLASGGVLVQTIPGTHSTLLQQPFVPVLARALASVLASASSRPSIC